MRRWHKTDRLGLFWARKVSFQELIETVHAGEIACFDMCSDCLYLFFRIHGADDCVSEYPVPALQLDRCSHPAKSRQLYEPHSRHSPASPSIFRAAKGRPKQPILGSAGCNFESRALTAETRHMAA